MRLSRYASVLWAQGLALALSSGADAASLPAEAVAAWKRDGQVEIRALSAPALPASSPAPTAGTRVPLGSLWKLFVFAYLSETRAAEPAYVCSASGSTPKNSEEAYCCHPGESVTRAAALAKSCAPYFAFDRLGISKQAWQQQWRTRTNVAWLLDPTQLQPQTDVPVAELLDVLDALPLQARAEARDALLAVGIEGYGREAWPVLGTGLRYKTYTWHRDNGSTYGGAAGWLADGTPFWFGASGSSRTALATWAPQLARMLPAPRLSRVMITTDTSCVDVDFFQRYPLRAVWHATQPVTVQPGILDGRYRLEFVNGNWLTITAQGELALDAAPGKTLRITGRFTLNDYVARVLDREAHPAQTQAARALAIVARSYLMQNAYFETGCWRIADSSRTQRVSPNPPTQAALDSAWFTDQLVLKGVAVQYHGDTPGPNRLAWKTAVAHDNEGWNFERILSEAYPQATFATLSGRDECTRLTAAEQWLTGAARAWSAKLDREPGYEAVATPLKICALGDGHPYSDQQRLRIYVRGWHKLDDRVTLAHEYLHLAFRFHPRGADEAYIERLARQLIEG